MRAGVQSRQPPPPSPVSPESGGNSWHRGPVEGLGGPGGAGRKGLQEPGGPCPVHLAAVASRGCLRFLSSHAAWTQQTPTLAGPTLSWKLDADSPRPEATSQLHNRHLWLCRHTGQVGDPAQGREMAPLRARWAGPARPPSCSPGPSLGGGGADERVQQGPAAATPFTQTSGGGGGVNGLCASESEAVRCRLSGGCEPALQTHLPLPPGLTKAAQLCPPHLCPEAGLVQPPGPRRAPLLHPARRPTLQPWLCGLALPEAPRGAVALLQALGRLLGGPFCPSRGVQQWGAPSDRRCGGVRVLRSAWTGEAHNW